jgi:hypothetical protein
MSRISKAGGMGSLRNARAPHAFAASALQAQPENIRAQRNTHRLGENVHEPRAGQAGNARKIL